MTSLAIAAVAFLVALFAGEVLLSFGAPGRVRSLSDPGAGAPGQLPAPSHQSGRATLSIAPSGAVD
jgi:hypothetical protein